MTGLVIRFPGDGAKAPLVLPPARQRNVTATGYQNRNGKGATVPRVCKAAVEAARFARYDERTAEEAAAEARKSADAFGVEPERLSSFIQSGLQYESDHRASVERRRERLALLLDQLCEMPSTGYEDVVQKWRLIDVLNSHLYT